MTRYLRSCCISLMMLGVCGWAWGMEAPNRPSEGSLQEDRIQDSFVPLFDGKSLEGWKNVNCAPSTWTVRDGMIHCTGKPTGELRTNRMYQNFIFEVEWRHLQPKGNSGIFVWADALTAPGQPFHRAVEVQVLDGKESSWYTSDGDIFPIHGATWNPENGREEDKMRAYPTEKRCQPSPEWNHYRIECVDGSISLAVNGKVVTRGSQCNLRKGYICLESEGSPVDFRNLRIAELPDSALEPSQVAHPDEGFESLYNGVDLSGWLIPEGLPHPWKVKDWQLQCDGLATGDASTLRKKNLWSAKSYENFVLIVDWRWNLESAETEKHTPNGLRDDKVRGIPEVAGAPDFPGKISGIILRGTPMCQVSISQAPGGSGGLKSKGIGSNGTDKSLSPSDRSGAPPMTKMDRPAGQWNRFRITLIRETITVVLNGETVVDNSPLPGIPAKGPIALGYPGCPIDFANLFIKPLP